MGTEHWRESYNEGAVQRFAGGLLGSLASLLGVSTWIWGKHEHDEEGNES